MTPHALSHRRDVKHADRPPPRDPKAAGTPADPSQTDQAPSSPDEAFGALVDAIANALGAKPAADAGKTNTDDGQKISADDKPAEQQAATAEAAQPQPADAKPPVPAAVPVVLATPHPPAPPPVGPKGDHKDAGEPEHQAKDPRLAGISHAGPRDAMKVTAEAAEPKKPVPVSAPTEKFDALLSEAKAPAETVLAPQALPHAAPRPAEAPAPLPPAPAPAAPATPPLPVVALPAAIAIKALDGANRFDIRLDPEDLGRVDVSLEIDKDGGIRASIAAEKPEALQLIVREAKSLEQAFDQAGFRRDDNALSFSLSDQRQFSQSQQQDSQQQSRPQSTRFFVEGEADLPPALASMMQSADGRLDVRI